MEDTKISTPVSGQEAPAAQTSAAGRRPWYSLKREDLNRPLIPGVPYWIVLAIVWLGFFVILSLAVTGRVSAMAWSGPGSPPPTGNIPSLIWNRVDTTVQQTGAAIDIDGGGPATTKPTGISVGSRTLDLGSGAGGQNVIWGGALYNGMRASTTYDFLLLLQTYGTSWTNRASIDRDGNLAASGNIKAGVCLGATFVGLTASGYDGDLDTGTGYYNANNKCSSYGTGAHVCSSSEMMMSLKCATGTSPIKTTVSGTDAWMQDGPPGYTAPANDCMGWQSNAGTSLGRMWRFDPTTGGRGFLTTCNQTIKFACCL